MFPCAKKLNLSSVQAQVRVLRNSVVGWATIQPICTLIV